MKNEILNLPHSLPPLQKYFDEVLVVDSKSNDGTEKLATHQFIWNGQYPKKRQWILDNIPTRHDWVFMVDADEIVTEDFITEIKNLDFKADGYFIKSMMVWNGLKLKYGLKNKKLSLFNKVKFEYPIIDDLSINGMGEMEGHYQPTQKNESSQSSNAKKRRGEVVTKFFYFILLRVNFVKLRGLRVKKIQSINCPIIHHDRKGDWHARHDKYVTWEMAMNHRNAWPEDPIPWREFLKSRLRDSYLRPIALFAYSYIFRFGFLNGRAGFDYAFNRARYTYRIVRATRQTNDAP